MSVGAESQLPELAAVSWRPRVDERALRHRERLWTLSVFAYVVPAAVAAIALALLNPITIPLGVILLVHAWIVPELYASRGGKVVRPRRGASRTSVPPTAATDPELVALGLLGDLVDDAARELHGRTGLVRERGRLGVWLLGEAGALLVRPGGRRVNCYCVGVADPGLPASDRTAHLLLALREDERGFATVANLAFSGARWRVRRRVQARAREALAVAGILARR